MASIGNIDIKGINKGKPKLKADGMVVQFYQTTKSLKDLEVYNTYIKDIEKMVRRSKEYKAYKNFLMNDVGLNHCFTLPNISTDLGDHVTIEMHHGPLLTLYDCCSIVVDHLLANNKPVTTFRVANLILKEHELHNIQVVMSCDVVHKLYHSNGTPIYVNPNQAWGKLGTFLEKYCDGLDDRRKTIIKTNLELAKNFHSVDKNDVLRVYKVKKWDDR